jgi:O-acetyl-ADP-ribose deacetylase (regulator of RNase III)
MALFEELRWLMHDEKEEDVGFEGPLVNIDPVINRKMYLFQGDAYKIPFDAVIVGENESCSDRKESSGIFALAGPQTENDLMKVTPVQTGQSALVFGGNLCQHIIVSVGPKFEEKYLTASEHALYTAYRSALTIASQQTDIKTLAITPIYLRSSRYPREQAAHVALRVIRRFMERSISEVFERVVLCVADDDFILYQLYMTGSFSLQFNSSLSLILQPLLMHVAYFPRDRQECLNQPEIIPKDMGNEWGDTAVEERSVKITVGPKPVEGEPHVHIPIPLAPGEDVHSDSGTMKDRRVSLSGSNTMVPTWPKPRSMMSAVEDTDTARIQKVS